MPAMPFEFEATFTAELIDQAAASFVHEYLFPRYGRWLVLACIINAAGLSLAVWLGANAPMVLSLLAALVVLWPVYLVFFYRAYPQRFATRLKQHFLPLAHFAVSSQSFGVRTAAGSATVPWSGVKAVLEFPAYFILVFTPFAFSVLPKATPPPEAFELLQARGFARVA